MVIKTQRHRKHYASAHCVPGHQAGTLTNAFLIRRTSHQPQGKESSPCLTGKDRGSEGRSNSPRHTAGKRYNEEVLSVSNSVEINVRKENSTWLLHTETCFFSGREKTITVEC